MKKILNTSGKLVGVFLQDTNTAIINCQYVGKYAELAGLFKDDTDIDTTATMDRINAHLELGSYDGAIEDSVTIPNAQDLPDKFMTDNTDLDNEMVEIKAVGK